jgi:hypothetical protein
VQSEWAAVQQLLSREEVQELLALRKQLLRLLHICPQQVSATG